MDPTRSDPIRSPCHVSNQLSPGLAKRSRSRSGMDGARDILLDRFHREDRALGILGLLVSFRIAKSRPVTGRRRGVHRDPRGTSRPNLPRRVWAIPAPRAGGGHRLRSISKASSRVAIPTRSPGAGSTKEAPTLRLSRRGVGLCLRKGSRIHAGRARVPGDVVGGKIDRILWRADTWGAVVTEAVPVVLLAYPPSREGDLPLRPDADPSPKSPPAEGSGLVD